MSNNPLAKLNTAPSYTMILPSTGKPISYRPFLVAEHKILQIAKKSDDVSVYAKALSDIIRRCTYETIDPNTLSSYDLEVFLLRLRQKSIGETVDLEYRCNNTIDDTGKKCGTKIEYTLPLESVSIEPMKSGLNVLELSNNLIVTMRYPNIANIVEIEKLQDEDTAKFIAESIISIATNDELFLSQDIEPKYMIDFVDNMSPRQIEKIIDFYEEFPTIRHKIILTCPKCGNSSTIELEGIQDFFG